MSQLSLHAEKCHKVPVNPFDNALAVDQMEVAYASLLARNVTGQDLDVAVPNTARHLALDGLEHPRIVS